MLAAASVANDVQTDCIRDAMGRICQVGERGSALKDTMLFTLTENSASQVSICAEHHGPDLPGLCVYVCICMCVCIHMYIILYVYSIDVCITCII